MPANQPGVSAVSPADHLPGPDGAINKAMDGSQGGVAANDAANAPGKGTEALARRRAFIHALARQAARELAGKPNKEPSD